MPVPRRVSQWVEDRFKKPRVDPEWLDGCYQWLTTEGGQDVDRDYEGLVRNIVHQLLESNFGDSMLPGTGFSANVANPTTNMILEPILVEVAALTRIGNNPLDPRGTLKFELTDGTIVLPAVECRPLPELSLENTPLGYKV
ncbi:hypothetical protein FPV67DRAFT_1440058, partial [Lyophyllum atratum]